VIAAHVLIKGTFTGAAALAVVACDAPPPDRQTMMAQSWTCEMLSEANGLTSRFVETMNLRSAGDYRSKATVSAPNATMQLEWVGRWTLEGDVFRRTFSALKATEGERDGEVLPQQTLDRAANEFRRGPVAEEGVVLSLSEREMRIETNFDPMTCTR
jgi:hypothetical protein